MNPIISQTFRNFKTAPLRSLIVGNFNPGNESCGNFHAIRCERTDDGGVSSDYLVILTPKLENKKLPYLCDPLLDDFTVFNLGVGWRVDVQVSAKRPLFERKKDSVIIMSGGDLFMVLSDGGYLDIQTGSFVSSPPQNDGIATWDNFKIFMPCVATDGNEFEAYDYSTMGK